MSISTMRQRLISIFLAVALSTVTGPASMVQSREITRELNMRVRASTALDLHELARARVSHEGTWSYINVPDLA